jgi:hypothetical protein
MSINGVFTHVTDAEIGALLAAQERTVDFLHGFDPAERLARELNIEKTWHALHWLLTGSAEEGDPPLNFIVAGGDEVGEGEDVGYGAPRAFISAQVRTIHQALTDISTADLIGRYDGHAMQDLYPEVWNRPEEQHVNQDDLAYRFETLKAFVAVGVELGYGMLVYAT